MAPLDPHTSRTLGRKLTPRERALLAQLYVRLDRRDRRLQRVAARHHEPAIEVTA